MDLFGQGIECQCLGGMSVNPARTRVNVTHVLTRKCHLCLELRQALVMPGLAVRRETAAVQL